MAEEATTGGAGTITPAPRDSKNADKPAPGAGELTQKDEEAGLSSHTVALMEAREEILERAQGGHTATGRIREEEERDDIPQGEDRGSTREIVGEAEADAVEAPSKPQGMQAEPALITRNGTVPVNRMPSPSGLIPAAATTDRGTRLRSGKDLSSSNLTAEDVDRLNGAELRAVATDRGLELRGSRTGLRARLKEDIAKTTKASKSSK